MDAQEMSFQNVVDTVLKPAGVKVGGYPDDIFLELGDEERERWQCSICYMVSRQAKECDNGHLFCATCVFAWSMTYGANSDKCPVCRSKQNDYKPRTEVDESIGHKRVRCPEPACSFRAPLTYLLKHNHGAERFGSGGVDLESLRRARPAPVNPFLSAGSGVIFLPLLRAPGAGSGPSREGRSLLQDMMMVLHLEMELRRRAIERFSSEEDRGERVRHMTEVLAIQEQMQEITGFLNLLFSVTPHRRNEPTNQDSRQAEQSHALEAMESDDEDEADDDDSSSDSETSLLSRSQASSRSAAAAAAAAAGGIATAGHFAFRRQVDAPSHHATSNQLPSPAHILAPVPPSVPRPSVVTPRSRWREETLDVSGSGSQWPPSSGDVPPASFGLNRVTRLLSPQPPTVPPPPPTAPPPPLQPSTGTQTSLLRPSLAPHPPHVPASWHGGVAANPSAGVNATSVDDGVASFVPLARRTPRLDEARVADTASTGPAAVSSGLSPLGSATYQAAMRQLPPIARPSATASGSVSPSSRLPEITTDLVPAPPPQRERSVFSSLNEETVVADSSAAPPAAGGSVVRGVRRLIRRRKINNGPAEPPPPPPPPPTVRRDQEPSPAAGPLRRWRLAESSGGTPPAPRAAAAAANLGNGGGGTERPRLNRTRGIDLMSRNRDGSSSQRGQ